MPDGRLHVFWHEDVLLHDTGCGLFEVEATPLVAEPERHPESDHRVRNMKAILERGPIRGALVWHEGRLCEPEGLALVHEPAYVEMIRELCASGGGRLTRTTLLSARSWEAARAAAGTSLVACQAVLDGTATRAFALVRPPGHHAQPAQADGYCIFNNVALAAELACRRGIDRVAILDWDVHHGNGTQEIFYRRADVLTISLHMRHGSWGPSHPQTGSPLEVGVGEGAGFNVNVELPLGCGDAGYRKALREVVVPIVDRFRPELILCAAGQDANQFDPNGRMCVTVGGFYDLGRTAAELADRHCGGRLVAVQEGGYALTYAGYCLHGMVEGMAGAPRQLPDPLAYLPDDPTRADEGIAAVRGALGRFWRF